MLSGGFENRHVVVKLLVYRKFAKVLDAEMFLMLRIIFDVPALSS